MAEKTIGTTKWSKVMVQTRERILIENVNAKIKVFKITSNKCRNRRKRYGLRMSLICGIINFEGKV